jgi:hypothetical protein
MNHPSSVWTRSDGRHSARALLSIASRDVPRLKSVHRIHECMRACVQFIVVI